MSEGGFFSEKMRGSPSWKHPRYAGVDPTTGAGVDPTAGAGVAAIKGAGVAGSEGREAHTSIM